MWHHRAPFLLLAAHMMSRDNREESESCFGRPDIIVFRACVGNRKQRAFDFVCRLLHREIKFTNFLVLAWTVGFTLKPSIHCLVRTGHMDIWSTPEAIPHMFVKCLVMLGARPVWSVPIPPISVAVWVSRLARCWLRSIRPARGRASCRPHPSAPRQLGDNFTKPVDSTNSSVFTISGFFTKRLGFTNSSVFTKCLVFTISFVFTERRGFTNWPVFTKHGKSLSEFTNPANSLNTNPCG